jgi:hypothetical protein
MRINVVLATGFILVACMNSAHASHNKPVTMKASTGATQSELDAAVSLLKFSSAVKERRPASFVRDDGSEVSDAAPEPHLTTAVHKHRLPLHGANHSAAFKRSDVMITYTSKEHYEARRNSHSDTVIYESPSGSGFLHTKPPANLLSRHLSAAVFSQTTH